MSELYLKRDIRDHVLSGVTLVIRSVQAQGGAVNFVAGVLAMAEHDALAAGVDWPDLLEDARRSLSASALALVDQALRIEAGNI